MNDQEIIKLINEKVEASLPILQPHIRLWVEKHLATPRPITLSLNEMGEEKTTLWLVTDHIGVNDSSCRVVFDNERDSFGLEMAMPNNIHLFMGFYGSFDNAVEAI